MAQRYFRRDVSSPRWTANRRAWSRHAPALGVVELPVMVGAAILDLIQLPGLQEPSDKDVWVLYHRDFRRTARVRAFVMDMRQQFRALTRYSG
ncbi:hypothetical protein ACHMW7_26290 [Aminobacter sp. UC22_36]|uniref:hypothetical protein n=1 Tax=Aminobacter sp. UC22_36 TaxID=3374549 RepID=UPI003757F783